MRQAVAYGLDRQSVVDNFYGGLGEVAKEFQPPTLSGYADNVTEYTYDPAKAKELLQKAGVTLPLQVDFWYPTSVSRPYMPDPKRNFEAFAASLNKSGFKVVPHSAPWTPDYLGRVLEGNGGALNFLGQTGDYADADNFIGIFFQGQKPQWGFNNPELTKALDEAETSPTSPSARRSTRRSTGRSWTTCRGSRSRLQVGARVQREHQGICPEPHHERVVREGLDREETWAGAAGDSSCPPLSGSTRGQRGCRSARLLLPSSAPRVPSSTRSAPAAHNSSTRAATSSGVPAIVNRSNGGS